MKTAKWHIKYEDIYNLHTAHTEKDAQTPSLETKIQFFAVVVSGLISNIFWSKLMEGRHSTSQKQPRERDIA